jgi:hypothetical protein
MSQFTGNLAVFTLVLLTSAHAQDAAPGPAPELKRFEPLIGNWTGTGKFMEPGKVTPWRARGSYRWCLGGHFVQEDFTIAFEGNPAPLVFRAYLGWDSENRCYVNASVNNGGQAQLHEMQLLPDGTMVQLMLQHQKSPNEATEEWLPYAERSLFKVDGDTLTHTIDLLVQNGASMTLVDGKFQRGGEAFDGAFDGPTWMGAKTDESIQRLVRSAGEYDVKGQIWMEAGKPPIAMRGVDTFRSVYGGTVLHGHTRGTAEGVPGEYVGEAFWAADPRRKRLTCIYVGSFGEVMTMAGHWAADGKLVVTSSSVAQGQPYVQRLLLGFDAAGALIDASCHSIAGAGAPFESLRLTYSKKQ